MTYFASAMIVQARPPMLQLVNELGQTTGFAPKLVVHERGGLLHRAVSVVLVDCRGRMLIQRRAASKYHFAEKWANACCSHPHESEGPIEAGSRTLRHELGIQTELVELTTFCYVAHDPISGYTEQEFDHVLLGIWNDDVEPNPVEVAETKWVSGAELRSRFTATPDDFACWFRRIIEELIRLPKDRIAASPEVSLFLSGYLA